MTSLDDIVKKTVFLYAVGDTHLLTFPLSNESPRVYAVNIIDVPVGERPAGVVGDAMSYMRAAERYGNSDGGYLMGFRCARSQ